MKQKLLLLGLAVLLEIPLLYPQTPTYHHYTISDGLASSIVYEMVQDPEGFVWFATANGISRFDGTHFKTFRMQDGLNSNSNTTIARGRNGELYIGNYEKGINIRKQVQFRNLCTEIDGRRFAISSLLVVPLQNGDQELYAYRSWGAVAAFHENTHGVLTGRIISVYPKYLNKLGQSQEGELIALTTDGLYRFECDTLVKMTIPGLTDQPFYSFTTGAGGSFLAGTRGMIYRIRTGRIAGAYRIAVAGENDVSVLLEDRQGTIWFSIMNKGFYCIPADSGTIIDMGIKMGLQNSNINSYLEDTEGNIWISTYGKGVFCLHTRYLKTLNETDGLSNNCIYSLVGDESGNLLAGTFNGLDLLKNGTIERIRSDSNQTLTEYIHSIKGFGDEFYVCGGFRGGRIQTITRPDIKLHFIDYLSFLKTTRGLYLFGTGFNFLRVRRTLNGKDSESGLFHVFGDSNQVNRINEIFEDSDHRIWIGTGLGLCLVADPADTTDTGEWKRRFFPQNPVLYSRINAMLEARDKTLWFAGEQGIARLDPETDSVTTSTHLGGYDLTYSTSLALDNQGRIWAGNMKGLYLIDGPAVKFLNRASGLPSDEVYSLYFDPRENVLYAGTSNGIILVDVRSFDAVPVVPPDVKITGIRAGDSSFTDYNNLVFTPAQHDVSIDYKAICFSAPGSVRYRCRLNHEEWAATETDFLNLISLKPGLYILEIKAKAQNTDWGNPVVLTFHVLPRFTETFWFDMLILVTIICIALFLVLWRQRINRRKVRKELALSERFNQLEHQAVSAMMNPHFLSNSLNSVQYLMNSERNEEANNYIVMMASLMRKNLDTAGSGFILLSEEVIRLKLYLDLEKLRLQEGFFYTIHTEKGIDTTSVMIPNMIIQPFVENSIWHGIIPSGKQGLVTVSFHFDDVKMDSFSFRSMIIKITDNGIGINKAGKDKKEDHISKGIKIVEERLRLLCMKMQLPKPVLIEDLSSRQPGLHGTEVILSLPPPLYKQSVPSANSISSPAGHFCSGTGH